MKALRILCYTIIPGGLFCVILGIWLRFRFAGAENPGSYNYGASVIFIVGLFSVLVGLIVFIVYRKLRKRNS